MKHFNYASPRKEIFEVLKWIFKNFKKFLKMDGSHKNAL